MKSPAGDQPCDVIYHRYPSKDFDEAQKPIPMALTVHPDTDDEEASGRQIPMTPPSNAELQSPACNRRSFCARLGRLLAFHTMNAVLGIGGAILVLVLVPLSVALIPLFGVGVVLFQVSAVVVEVLAKSDVCLANMVQRPLPKLRKAFGIQSGFSTNNGCNNCCARLLFLSPKMLLVMLYFATIKLAVGILSTIAVGWGLALPVEALCSGGHADAIGWIRYEDHPGAYVGVVIGGWVLGMLCIAFVPKPSVALTKWACAEHEAEEEIHSAKAACGLSESITNLEAAVNVEAPEAKAAAV